ERADGVEHHRGIREELGERRDVVGHLDDLVVGGLDAGDAALHGDLELAAVAAGSHEGDVVLAEVLADQPAGVAGGAVDDDRAIGHRAHIPIPPSTGRPTPLTKREASEARKTTASAMSSTSPSRPDGVSPTTASTASSGEAKRPSAAMSTARPWPIAVGTRPG